MNLQYWIVLQDQQQWGWSQTYDGTVATYADLPDATLHEWEVYLVTTTTGLIWFRKYAGTYFSDWSAWIYDYIRVSWSSYDWVSPTNTTVWGLASWTDISWYTLSQVIQSMVVSYLAPAFSSFWFTQSSPVEVWTTISWTKTFTWATTNSGNVATNSVSILDVTWSQTLVSWSANDGTESLDIGTIQKTTATSHTWRISATNTQSWSFTRDFTVAWQWKKYYWESTETSLNETQIESLRVWSLSTWFAGTYSFSAWWYKYLAYPSSFWTATTFKDASTNLWVPFEPVQTISITNANWIATTYNIHRTTNILGGSINIIVS